MTSIQNRPTVPVRVGSCFAGVAISGLRLKLLYWFLFYHLCIDVIYVSYGLYVLYALCVFMFYICSYISLDIVEFLLMQKRSNIPRNHTIQVDARDAKGRTPFLLACVYGQFEMAKMLLQIEGADPTVCVISLSFNFSNSVTLMLPDFFCIYSMYCSSANSNI